MKSCLHCNTELNWYQQKYCSNRCQSSHQYEAYIQAWKSGKEHGGVGIFARSVSGHIKRYLAHKFGDKCALCGWNRKNPVTNKVPLEIDHIDGNAEHNEEGNLRLICPNCHSLSPNFRNLNKGNGRAWRKNKYIKHAKYAVP